MIELILAAGLMAIVTIATGFALGMARIQWEERKNDRTE